ncbi:hypothetical protein GGF32_005694 [Allomyces javanicus]|nr:hypothetical protein GGF32_005694 [Allomyces javanicus]
MAFLGTTGGDANQVRSLLLSLTAQIKTLQAESSMGTEAQRELALEPRTEGQPNPDAQRLVIVMPFIVKTGKPSPREWWQAGSS